jgi:16S rRNA C967 or C1407 C5-methylase (RsmB/RsmF family)
VSTCVYDAARFPDVGAGFDAVIADVPCTSEGTSRKHPRALLRAGEARSRELGFIQHAILRRAVQLCRPGGRVAYSTCTYAPEENEVVVDRVVRALGDGAIRVLRVRPDGLICTDGITRWGERALHPSVAHTLRVWPHHNDTGGFFVAILERLK